MKMPEHEKTTTQPKFSEAELLAGCRAGAREALEALIKQYQPAVLRVCVSMLGTREVEDLVQDIFIKILKKIQNFEGRAALFTWIYEITVNHCRDELRKRKRRRWFSLHALPQETVEQIPLEEASASEQMEAGEMRYHLRRALNQLEPKYRELVVLRDLEGLSYEEIAKARGLAEKLVKSRLYQARQILAASMKKYLEEVAHV
ncbi:RNA polymerase sigma factor [candidate division KSB1 bacterium]|nr:RNA polymerase sigma factor [candidate division KSB1 bacterium]